MLKTITKRILKVLLAALTSYILLSGCFFASGDFRLRGDGGYLFLVALACLLVISVIYYILTCKFNPYRLFKDKGL